MLGDGATEHHFARGLQLRDAGSEAHPVVAAWCAGGVCNSGGGEPGGRRSSGIQALGVTGHGGRGRWALRVAGVTRNTRRQRAQVEELGSTKLTVHGGGRSSGSVRTPTRCHIDLACNTSCHIAASCTVFPRVSPYQARDCLRLLAHVYDSVASIHMIRSPG